MTNSRYFTSWNSKVEMTIKGKTQKNVVVHTPIYYIEQLDRPERRPTYKIAYA